MKFSLVGYRNSIRKNFEHDERLTRDNYQTIIAVTASLCGMVHGFITTESDLLLTNSFFLQMGKSTSTVQNVFLDHFLLLFFAGELLGKFFFQDELVPNCNVLLIIAT